MAMRWEKGGNKDWVYVNTSTGKVSKEYTDAEYRDYLRRTTDKKTEQVDRKKETETMEPRGTEVKDYFNLDLLVKGGFLFIVFKIVKGAFN